MCLSLACHITGDEIAEGRLLTFAAEEQVPKDHLSPVWSIPRDLSRTCVLTPRGWTPEVTNDSLWEVILATASSPCVLSLPEQVRHEVQW